MGKNIGKRGSDKAEIRGDAMVFYIDGSPRKDIISLMFEKDYAISFAKGLLDAAEGLPEGMPDVGMELDVALIPKNKIMVMSGEGSIQ